MVRVRYLAQQKLEFLGICRTEKLKGSQKPAPHCELVSGGVMVSGGGGSMLHGEKVAGPQRWERPLLTVGRPYYL